MIYKFEKHRGQKKKIVNSQSNSKRHWSATGKAGMFLLTAVGEKHSNIQSIGKSLENLLKHISAAILSNIDIIIYMYIFRQLQLKFLNTVIYYITCISENSNI